MDVEPEPSKTDSTSLLAYASTFLPALLQVDHPLTQFFETKYS